VIDEEDDEYSDSDQCILSERECYENLTIALKLLSKTLHPEVRQKLNVVRRVYPHSSLNVR
jgi:hypothetical protein